MPIEVCYHCGKIADATKDGRSVCDQCWWDPARRTMTYVGCNHRAPCDYCTREATRYTHGDPEYLSCDKCAKKYRYSCAECTRPLSNCREILCRACKICENHIYEDCNHLCQRARRSPRNHIGSRRVCMLCKISL